MNETLTVGAGEEVVVAFGSVVVVEVLELAPGQEQGGGVGAQVTVARVPLVHVAAEALGVKPVSQATVQSAP